MLAKTADEIVLRMMHEKIPLKAIARVMQRPFSDLVLLARDFKEAGKLVEAPPNDWNQSLHLNAKETRFEDKVRLCLKLKLTDQQADLVARLMRAGTLSHDQIENQLSRPRGGEPGLVARRSYQVVLYAVRKKLAKAPVRVQISTAFGVGIVMSTEDRERLIKLCYPEEE